MKCLEDRRCIIDHAVASLAEAWIEMDIIYQAITGGKTSPPSRRRGLKSDSTRSLKERSLVASLAEAWIEMNATYPLAVSYTVASLAEAWIEIIMTGLHILAESRRLPRGGVD